MNADVGGTSIQPRSIPRHRSNRTWSNPTDLILRSRAKHDVSKDGRRHGLVCDRPSRLDDWGLEPLNAAARHDLLEILEERYGRRSTIITSQIPVDKWHDLIGDPTYADAILDRVVHNAHRINLTGHSLRRSRAGKTSKE
jgi:hypothetical protein